MRERILQKLAAFPNGARLRYLMGGIGCREDVLHVLLQLAKEGLVIGENVNDYANLERYILWRLV